MLFNVLVADGAEGRAGPLLVVKFGTAPRLPEQLRTMHWRELATVELDDHLLKDKRHRIEAEVAARGYSLLTAQN